MKLEPPQRGPMFATVCTTVCRQNCCCISCVQSRDDTDSPFSGVCEYQIVCERSIDGVRPYPPCAHTSWGPGDSAGKYSLTPLHGDAAVLVAPDDGVVEVRLETSPDLRFSTRLKSVDSREDHLSSYVLQRIVNNIAIFLVKVIHRQDLSLVAL